MMRRWLLAGLVAYFGQAAAAADDLPIVGGVDRQPLAAQAARVVEALAALGAPLPAADRAALVGADADADAIQRALDPHCLAGVVINAEARVEARRGPAPPRLAQQGWSVYLVKVHNLAGVTAPLVVTSPNAAPVLAPSTNAAEPKHLVEPPAVADRWLEVGLPARPPLRAELSGLAVEYRVIQLYSRDAGPREARLTFSAGRGTQDLGSRSDLDVLFTCAKSVSVALEVLDVDHTPTTASFTFRDARDRLYPHPGRRLAPDFYFQEQVYRRSGETIDLPPGEYEVVVARGPEYRPIRRRVMVPDAPAHRESFQLERWVDPAARGWYSGDHHVHAAGCGHYESPTEGVGPADMARNLLGEDVKVGCVLTWGPCWYTQKRNFDGRVIPLEKPGHLMRYDVEVSGFPSSHAGHLCLLRLKEDDYPGTTRIEQWPSWDLPVLRWGRAQGGIVGFSHSGWGLATASVDIPNYEVPPYDGIGANEFVVDVAHDAVDFLSLVDTPAPWEMNMWYHTLSAGYRARGSGETDFPCIYGERVGIGRSYVQLDGPLDFDRWAAGIKAGRSYVGDGKSHLMDFAVGGTKVGVDGSELRLDAPGTVRITADVAAMLGEPTDRTRAVRARPVFEKPYWDLERARIGETRRVPIEVVVNGLVVARREVEADGVTRPFAVDVPIARSSWVALRIHPSSHTNPVFVVVGGAPIRASRRSAEWCLAGVERCWTQKMPQIREAERAEARRAYDLAAGAYRRIAAESFDDR